MALKQIATYKLSNISDLYSEILGSAAFKRLENITFLGILSPKYQTVCRQSNRFGFTKRFGYDDGSRKDHSEGVALELYNLTLKNGLSEKAQRYAVCWGLLHDIATWPLSHTGEAAFTRIFNRTSDEVRSMMILGSLLIPAQYRLNDLLEKIGVVPDHLVLLFDKQKRIEDQELAKLWYIIHSPITPDTLEGIWRSGKVYKINVPSPSEISRKINTDLYEAYIRAADFSSIAKFWKQKSKIYRLIINSAPVIQIESNWSNSILEYFKGISLHCSFELTEAEVIEKVLKNGILISDKTVRYKTPKIYYLNKWTQKNKIRKKHITLTMLQSFLKHKDQSQNVPRTV